MKINRIAKTAVATTGVVAFAMAAASTSAVAADKKAKKEKCYGIVAKGMNDCGTSTHSCAGQAKVDNHPEEWIYVTKGLCKRIAGSTKKPKKA
ncbi:MULTISPECIES: DUF2282 domain-containing protein [Kordiimonas]|uniref:BufA1 family periplasmic bufferin-type metallophore n=1 Tax=Kordiimonas TaxID=288021 RepID=UPI001FF54B23|nr:MULTISPECIES: DUF2282 domain-containing protein [Kordiimonas]MCK0070459.1 DUF2282 domain-containing protein [Kordiimonas laminariae]UTW57599.1 DUF2282 domain-containing protein [Kordiimonas sp. SCSIO 12603]